MYDDEEWGPHVETNSLLQNLDHKFSDLFWIVIFAKIIISFHFMFSNEHPMWIPNLSVKFIVLKNSAKILSRHYSYIENFVLNEY